MNELFDPVETARKVERSYRDYISTTIHFSDAELQGQLEKILNESGFVAKGPFLEGAPPYTKGESIRDLVDRGVFCRGMLDLASPDPDRCLYAHQVRAIEKANKGRNYIVTTGTGSGKTECFLLPIFNDILSEFERDGRSPGVRAMILYPMNALANDQLKRLRSMLRGTGITFGRYTGDTKERESEAKAAWKEENPGQERMENELISREEIRETPPNILLTNYSMLEYLLLRPKDAPLFSSAFGRSWRHVAIDEAHVYSGTLGTEIAFLLRRLKARIASETGQEVSLRCYATSATMGSKDDLPKIAKFASDLFGEHFATEGDIDVITSEQDGPEKDLRDPWGSIPMEAWAELRSELQRDNACAESIAKALEGLAPREELEMLRCAEGPLVGLGRILLGESTACAVIRSMATELLDLTDERGGCLLGVAGLTSKSLVDVVEVLATAERSPDVPVLSSRYHSFLRAPEGIFLNLSEMSLSGFKSYSAESEKGYEVPVYETSVCRHCGEAYLLGQEDFDRDRECSWLSPAHAGEYADEDFLPRSYYRVLADPADADEGERVIWVCPECASTHDSRDGGKHRFAHDVTPRIPLAYGEADEEVSKCGHCGYRSKNAIQPMRVSPEAVGSVVCYDLVREVPPFEDEQDQASQDNDLFGFAEEEPSACGGSVICFSDKRQDAAYFAPAMERTYGAITVRQLIREAIEARDFDDEGCSPTRAISWLAKTGASEYPLAFEGADPLDAAQAWVVGEMTADDSRNSLEGLGVVRVEPTAMLNALRDPRIGGRAAEKQIGKLSSERFGWLSTEDYLTFVLACVESLRSQSALYIDPESEALLSNRAKPRFVVMGGESIPKDCISFTGNENGTENRRSNFIRRYAAQVKGAEVSREDARKLLASIYEYVTQLLPALGGKLKLMQRNPMVGSKEKFRLDKDLWTLYTGKSSDVVYVCGSCGRETRYWTNSVCPTHRCTGHLVKKTSDDARDKDRFYKETYSQQALPIRIEEHTAQLSKKRAREVQGDFIKGRVNVLSCTTTFELGVDVGDLRAVFMRNIPPKTANYVQRAGRVGRRAGKPGFAVTFARLRPHDLSLYKDPVKVVRGDTPAPACYLDNSAIAARHLYAIVLSEFFRLPASLEKGYSKKYHDFMDLSESDPDGMKELAEYLRSRPEPIAEQIKAVFPEGGQASLELDVSNWGWVPDLVEKGRGRLACAHALKHEDYARVDEAVDANREISPGKAAGLMRTIEALRNESTINVLAENGILPKYGFPTDLVELHIPAQESSLEDNRLQLQRGLRQAVLEYAPGAEVVAGKKVWKSVGIRKSNGQVLTSRYYGRCPNAKCRSFVWPIDDLSHSGKCPVCGEEFKLRKRMLIPSGGFNAKDSKKDPGENRPRTAGSMRVEFCQHWPEQTCERKITLPGGCVETRYASNGQLCAMNEGIGRSGFSYCAYCGAAAPQGETPEHQNWCKEKKSARFDAIGTAFVSDVLELRFLFNDYVDSMSEDWLSLCWALYASASRLLELPESEIGAIYYQSDFNTWSIMLYDNVPGGAGHTKQVAENIEDLLSKAYEIVRRCTCGIDTCCYGCLASYYNQKYQHQISRGAALKLLEQILGS